MAALAAALVVLLASLAAACGDDGGEGLEDVDALRLTGGETTLVLAPAMVAALDRASIEVVPVGPARAGGEGFVLPVTGDVVNPESLGGVVDHAGALRLVRGSQELLLEDLRLQVQDGFLFADPPEADLVGLALEMERARIERDDERLVATGIDTRMGVGLASLIEQELRTDAFDRDMLFGTLRVEAVGEPVT